MKIQKYDKILQLISMSIYLDELQKFEKEYQEYRYEFTGNIEKQFEEDTQIQNALEKLEEIEDKITQSANNILRNSPITPIHQAYEIAYNSLYKQYLLFFAVFSSLVKNLSTNLSNLFGLPLISLL